MEEHDIFRDPRVFFSPCPLKFIRQPDIGATKMDACEPGEITGGGTCRTE